MTRAHLFLVALGIAALAAPPSAHAIVVDLGSDGSDGALDVTTDTVLPLPDDGIFHFTTVTVAAGARLSFSYAGTFHPGVVMLATGDVTIDGTIDVGGMDSATSGIVYGGPGGSPGGFPNQPGRPPLDYDYIRSLRRVGGRGGAGEDIRTSSCTATVRGGGGGGVLLLFANGTIRGSGTIDASGGAVTGTGISCSPNLSALPGVDGEVVLVSPRLDGAGLTVIARAAQARTYERVGDPTFMAFNAGGALTNYQFLGTVRPWIPEPTATITHVDGVAVTAGTMTTVTAASSGTMDVTVRVTGCTGSTLQVYVQAWGGSGGSPSAVTPQTTVTPTGVDDVVVTFTSVVTTDSGYQLRTGFNCRP